MLASDILPPRTTSARGTMAMLKRLEDDSVGRYRFQLLPQSSVKDYLARGGQNQESRVSLVSGRQYQESRVSPVDGGNANGKGGPNPSDWSWLPDSARKSPTGLALLYTKQSDAEFSPRLAIAPPFPIESEMETTDREYLRHFIDPPLHVGIILIRYGYVAIAVAHDESLVLTKTETRWVPNRHRAGGQSANRFKRSREKWAREFFDKSARLAADRFGKCKHRIDYLIFGGDRHVISQFLQRAKLPDKLTERVLTRRLNTHRPNREALKTAVREAWSSTIYELAA